MIKEKNESKDSNDFAETLCLHSIPLNWTHKQIMKKFKQVFICILVKWLTNNEFTSFISCTLCNNGQLNFVLYSYANYI